MSWGPCMSALSSGGFWAFVGVVAGIYTIFALGLQLQFGFTGLLNFGHVAFMAIGAYTMAILIVKEGWSTWLAAPLGVLAAAAAGLLLGLPSLREDEDAAASVGKNVVAYKLQSLALGAALAGTAGCFYAWQFSFFSPDDFQPLLTFFAWMIVILGGLGRVVAVPVGAVVFGFLFAGTRFLDFPPLSYLGGADRAYVRLIVIGLVIIGLV